MTYRCELVEQPTQMVLLIRAKTSVDKLPQFLGQAYGQIIKYLAELDKMPSGVPFAAYYNMDMQDLDVAAGFPISETLPDQNEIKVTEIPGGKFATCLHVGPYNMIEPAYNALMQWIQDNGYTPTGVAYEFYLNDPSVTPENELQTKVMFPLV